MLNENRDIQADVVRVIAMLMVVAVHIPLDIPGVGNNICKSIFLTCNGLFLMLSGRFNLCFKAEEGYEKERIFSYYIKKVHEILIPFILYSAVIYIVSIFNVTSTLNWKGHIWAYMECLLSKNAGIHLWYMYALFGMLILVPFISKMVQSLSTIECKILFVIYILWKLFTVMILSNFLQLGVPYSGYLLDGFMVYFILGAIYNKIVTDERKKYFIIIGAICLGITIVQSIFLPERSNGIFDTSPVYILVVLGMYIFLYEYCVVKGVLLKKVIVFLSKYSYGVYLVHWVMKDLVRRNVSTETIGGWIFSWFLVFIMSLTFTMIFDNTIVKLVKRAMTILLKSVNGNTRE